MASNIYRVYGGEKYYRLSAFKDENDCYIKRIEKFESKERPLKSQIKKSAIVLSMVCLICVGGVGFFLIPIIEKFIDNTILFHYIYPLLCLFLISFAVYKSVYFSEHDRIIEWHEQNDNNKLLYLNRKIEIINNTVKLYIASKREELNVAKDRCKLEYEEKVKTIKTNYDEKLRLNEDYQALKKDFEQKLEKKNKEFERLFSSKEKARQEEFEIQKEQLRRQLWEYTEKSKLLSQKEELTKSMTPFAASACIRADLELKVLENAEFYFRHKERPSVSSAEKVALLKKELAPKIASLKEMQYKYEYLLKVFPELKVYVENEDLLTELSEFSQFSDFEKDVDRAREYLSREEWENMPVDERNQLALDNYMKRNKSNWVVGAEYEMYCSYILRKKKYKVQEFGIEKGLQDLGRDIIAKKGKKTYIIQCKRWSADKLIHENVICQIYGSTLEYVIEHGEQIGNVIPVLYTTTDLSDMAKRFAEKLGVRVHVEPMGEYPMIKCNYSSDGEMIYHLPFDQQYYNTKIENGKDFYAWTVKEAVEKGFRRAFKWTGLNN